MSTFTNGPACERVMSSMESDPTTSTTDTKARICGISYEMS